MFLNVDMSTDTQKSSQKYEAFVAFLTGGNQLFCQKENSQVQEINKQIKLVHFDVS